MNEQMLWCKNCKRFVLPIRKDGKLFCPECGEEIVIKDMPPNTDWTVDKIEVSGQGAL